MFISDPIFKRGTDGKIRQWNFIVDGDKWAVVADRIQPATILAAERVPDFLKD